MSNVFDLLNEAEGVEPQERMTSNSDDFHTEDTAPGGVGIPMQVHGCKVVDHLSESKPDGSVEYRVTFIDTSDTEHAGQLLTVRTYISRKQKDTTPAYNAAKFLELAQLGLTKEFMSAKPSLEAQGKHLKNKAAEVILVPAWEDSQADKSRNRALEAEGKDPLPVRRFLSLDTYWEKAEAKTGDLRPKV